MFDSAEQMKLSVRWLNTTLKYISFAFETKFCLGYCFTNSKRRFVNQAIRSNLLSPTEQCSLKHKLQHLGGIIYYI